MGKGAAALASLRLFFKETVQIHDRASFCQLVAIRVRVLVVVQTIDYQRRQLWRSAF